MSLWKCNDCRVDLEDANRSKKRADVCLSCWENRMWLIANMARVGQDAFQSVQKSMANGRGTAKRKIMELMARYPSETQP
jgi:hypothetical protein